MLGFGFGPSLSLRPPPRAGFDFGGGVLPPGARLTRASTGSRFDAAGVLRIEPADAARFDHDPATGALLGLLIEPERTNEALMSAALDNAVWTRFSGLTVESDAAPAPDGTSAADRFADSSASAFGYLTQNLAPAADRTISVFVAKDGVARTTRFAMFRGISATADLALDTKTGEFNLLGPAQGTVRDCGAFWRAVFRCSACDQIRCFPAVGASATWQYAVNATGAVDAWGFQAEQGSSATSYIPTAAAAATRAADVLTLDWGRLGVADGPLPVRYTFDDGSAQEGEAIVTDGRASVPTTLARPWIRRIERR